MLCDALVGFNGTAREERFAPVILSVENPGARMSAEISLTVTWGNLRGPVPGRTITREAVLDEGATRRFPFVIPLPRNTRTLRARVTSRGVEVGSLDIETRSLTIASRLVAGISSDFSLDSVAGLGSEGSLRVVYPRVDDLPQSWAGYDGVDAVIVHDTSFRQLRADQVAAIAGWVASGGVLVFTGGAAALQHESAGFSELLPVQISGLTQREGISVPVGGGAPRRVPGRVELANALVTSGRVLAADGALPLVVRRSLGRGTVWFLAFDPTVPPLRSWEGMLSLWRNILNGDRVPAFGAASKPAMEDPWTAAVFAAAPVSFPRVEVVLAFIGAYLALLAPLLLLRAAGRMRIRTRLLLLASVSVSATVVGWALFNLVLFHSGLQAMDAARVDARSGDGLAFAVEKIGLYAASAQSVEARLGSGDAVLEAAGLRVQQNLPPAYPHLVVAQAGAGAQVQGVHLERLGSQLVAVQGVIPFAVTVRVRTIGSSVQAYVSNGVSKPLVGCYIFVSGRALPLGDVAAGATVQRTYAASDVRVLSADNGLFKDDGRRELLFKAQEGDSPEAGPPRLIGWMDCPVLPISFPGSHPLGGVPGLALVSVEAE